MTYRELKEAGLCVRCGKASPVEGKTRCEPCAIKANKHIKNYIDRLLRNGMCSQGCGRPCESDRINCSICLDKFRVKKRFSRYDLTPTEYESLLTAQDGGCAICGGQEKLVIDHDHATGKVRGLLCSQHNTGLGMFQDNPERLLKAINYLQRLS